MYKLNWFGIGSMSLVVAGLFVMSASGAGCKGDEDADVPSEAGADAVVADSGVVAVVDSGLTGPCMTCYEITNASERIANSPGACEDNNVADSGKSSNQLFNEVYQCACEEMCNPQCGDSCISGAELGGLCTACAIDKCLNQYNACNEDKRVKEQPDSGADSGVDSGADASDAGAINDAAVDGQ